MQQSRSKPVLQRQKTGSPSQAKLEEEFKKDKQHWEEEKKKHQEAVRRAKLFDNPKHATIRRHKAQQHKVELLLNKARKIQPDPKKGLRDPDNLFHNTVELLDAGKLTLTVLSPTHFNSNYHFDSRVRFDLHNKQPIGGDYSASFPRNGVKGLVFDDSAAAGKVSPRAPTSSINTLSLPPIEEELLEPAPPEKSKPTPDPTPIKPAAASFVPGDIFYFTRGYDTTETEFKNMFVHEGQHVADWSPKLPLKAISANDILLESYKSEFRAFWIQPPIPGKGRLGPTAINRLPEPKGKADNSRKVTISKPKDCKLCKPSDASAPAEAKTEFKNLRQETIFWHLMKLYKAHQYDCCYMYDKKFRTKVNDFAYPESVNLINSDRLMDLNLELPNLNKSMTLAQVKNSKKFVVFLTKLDTLDWIFLNDPKLSRPFWDALKIAAPGFLYKAVNALVKVGTNNPVSAADVNKALSGK